MRERSRYTYPNGNYVVNPMWYNYNDGAGFQICGGILYTKEGECIGHIDPPGMRGTEGQKGIKK